METSDLEQELAMTPKEQLWELYKLTRGRLEKRIVELEDAIYDSQIPAKDESSYKVMKEVDRVFESARKNCLERRNKVI